VAQARGTRSSFRLALRTPALAKLGSGSRGLAQDERGEEGGAAAGLEGLLHPLDGYSDSGICFCNAPRLVAGEGACGPRFYFGSTVEGSRTGKRASTPTRKISATGGPCPTPAKANALKADFSASSAPRASSRNASGRPIRARWPWQGYGN